MARFGCLAVAVVLATVLLFFIVYLWSGWLNRPVGHAPIGHAPAAVGVAYDSPAVVAATAERLPAPMRVVGTWDKNCSAPGFAIGGTWPVTADPDFRFVG